MAARYLFRIAGMTIEVSSEYPMAISRDLERFLTENGEPDERITVSSLPPMGEPEQPPVFSTSAFCVTREAGGWCHSYPGLKGEDGSACAFHWRQDHCHYLYTPGSVAGLFQSTGRLAPFIVPELMLLANGRFFLHSSLVMYRDQAVLFCGPSGIGKSTQAELWEKHLGAEILNGDRAVIYEGKGGFVASGSPYSGSSGYYSPKEAPIAAIVLPEKADVEEITPIPPRQAVVTFLRESVQHSWDLEYTQQLTGLLAKLAETVPVYRLRCRPHAGAAELARKTIFPQEP